MILILCIIVGLCSCFLSMTGLVTAYICGLLGLGLGKILNLNNFDLAVVVITTYVCAFVGASLMEIFSGTLESSEAQMSMISNESIVPEVLRLPLFITKLSIFVIFVALPISSPSGYLVGIPALIVCCLLAYLSGAMNSRGIFYLMVQSLIIVITLQIYRFIGGGAQASTGIILALAAPRLAMGKARTAKPAVMGDPIEAFPNPLTMVIAGFLSWITPGYTSAAAMASWSNVNPLIGATLISAAIEGWVIQMFFSGASSGKTMLGSILNESASLDGSSLNLNVLYIGFVVVWAFIGCIWLMKYKPFMDFFGTPSTTVTIMQLIVQSLVLYGLGAFLFAVSGAFIYMFHRNMRATDLDRGLGLLSIGFQ